ncbi:MAG: phosphotransferase [Candidatus Pacebacteria bacterium]|nr:phosphotransferase [Candidatus Paceibacterota bacterium]
MKKRLENYLLKNFKNYWPDADKVKNIKIEEFQSLDQHSFNYRIEITLLKDEKIIKEVLRASQKVKFKIASFLLKTKDSLPSFILYPLDFLKDEKIFLYREIEGKPLRYFILKKYPPKKLKILVREVGIVLKLLHNFFKKYNFISSPSSPYIGSFEMLERYYPKWAAMAYDFKNEFKKKYQKLSGKKQIIHGDFTPANIIIQKDKELKIIDFSSVRRGFFLEDIACFFAQLDDLYLWNYISSSKKKNLQRELLMGYFGKIPSKNILKKINFLKSSYLLTILQLEFYPEVLLQNMGSKEKKVIEGFLRLIYDSLNV